MDNGDNQERVAEPDTENIEIAAADSQTINEAEEEEKTKDKTIVTFTEEQRSHEDFTKFFKRYCIKDQEL